MGTVPYTLINEISDEWYSFDLLGTPGDIVTNLDHLDQCIKVILTTPQGSVPHHPNWFNSLNDLVDRPVDTTQQLLVEGIQQSLELYEPRIEVLGITIVPVSDTELEKQVIRVRWRVSETEIESASEVVL